RGGRARPTTWSRRAPAAAGSCRGTSPERPKKKRAASAALPIARGIELRLRARHPASHTRALTLHPELGLARVKPETHAADDDGDQESLKVEASDRDLKEALVDHLQDRVQDHGANPADVADGVEPGDHDSSSESDAGHRSRDAEPGVERDPGRECRARNYQHAHQPHEEL